MAQHGGASVLCQAGFAHLAAGQLADAERSFAAVLAQEPQNLQGLLALGLIAWQQQRPSTALRYAEHAVQRAPRLPAAHLLLARVLRDAGQASTAVTAFRTALRLAPADNAARLELAQTLADSGLTSEAMLCYRTALRQAPTDVAGYYNLGNLLLRTGQAEAAVSSYEAALALQPDHAQAQNNLANALRQLGRMHEAEHHYRCLATASPTMAEAHYNLGNLLFAARRFAEAADCFRQALALRPDDPDTANNLGSALIELGDQSGAELHLRQAVERQPGQALPLSNLGAALREMGQMEAAEACFVAALELAGDRVPARNNLATTLLQTGRLEAGWALYESRWETAALPPRPFPQPLWQGQPLGDGVLLLHAEQGMGDTLQFCRYVAMAAERARVVLEVQPPLRTLLARCLPGVEQVVCRGERLPRFDQHCPLLSLPRVFGTTLETIPAAIPYLRADPAQTARWQARLGALPGKRIGLVWRGNPSYADSKRKRDMEPAYLSLLGEIPGLSFVSLQTGLSPDERVAAHSVLPLTDWTDELTDFDQTASLVAALDLVIGVDTAVVHLAGALGRPVWLLNRFDPCWRWLRDRDDSPWYPTLRQFRQVVSGDWAGPMQQVANCLASPSTFICPSTFI